MVIGARVRYRTLAIHLLPEPTHNPLSFIDYLLGVVLLLVGAFVALRIRRGWRKYKMTRRFAIGARAEVDAVALLERHGYAVSDEQVRIAHTFFVDGEETTCHIRADYLAHKGGQLFVIEVKSGEKAPNPKHSATRRQLLEYQHVYRPDGVILVDMEQGVLFRVDFGLTGDGTPPMSIRSGGHPMPWRALLVAVAVGLVLGLLI